MANHRHEPTDQSRKTVEAMAAYGIPHPDIARVVGVDKKTLEKYYRAELDTGHTKANARVAEALFKKAVGDGPQSVTAAIFWLKTRARWKETHVLEHAGDGPTFRIEIAQPRLDRILDLKPANALPAE